VTKPGPPTTEELLDAAEARTGLARNQLLMMVAKSVTVRHLARHSKYGPLFVLKGGTLLTHVYQSPRQSIKDADYTYLDPQTLTTPELERALAINGDYGFHLKPEQGVWVTEGDMFDGKTPFSMEGIELGRKAKDRELKITVSVRGGERLDQPTEPLYYYDPLLAEDKLFEVNGLTINELSSEKIIGWCSKPLPKHYVDLAYVGREHQERVDHDHVAELVERKFRAEKAAGRHARLDTAGALVESFHDERKLKELSRGWDELVGGELLFLPGELAKDTQETLTVADNVVRIASEFWQPTLDRLKN